MTRIALAFAGVLLGACSPTATFLQGDHSPDGRWVALPSGADIVMHDGRSGGIGGSLKGGHDAAVTAVAFARDGRTLFSGDKDGRIVVWDLASGQAVGMLTGHEGSIEHLAVRTGSAPDLASASGDRTVKLWDTAGRAEVRTLAGHRKAVTFVGWSPDGKRVVSASKDKTVKVWTAEDGSQFRALVGHEKPLRSAQFSPDGSVLATGAADGAIRLWDLEKGTERLVLAGAPAPVIGLHFSRDGAWLVAYQLVQKSFENLPTQVAGIWNCRTGEQVVSDYREEVKHAPGDWPYRSIMQDVGHRVTHGEQ